MQVLGRIRFWFRDSGLRFKVWGFSEVGFGRECQGIQYGRIDLRNPQILSTQISGEVDSRCLGFMVFSRGLTRRTPIMSRRSHRPTWEASYIEPAAQASSVV